MRVLFQSFRLPRNPLARLGLALLAVLLLVVAWGVVLVAAVGIGLALAARALWLGLRGPGSVPAAGSRPADPDIIEGEFRVISRERESIQSRR
ncbi:MAG TPA: hypothetical protein VFG21_02530 [Xanthomonadaceae bacterium]|nr:hypothetical protein [Xanthomonadaceae bacterium]